jgi:hypothetical protein
MRTQVCLPLDIDVDFCQNVSDGEWYQAFVMVDKHDILTKVRLMIRSSSIEDAQGFINQLQRALDNYIERTTGEKK